MKDFETQPQKKASLQEKSVQASDQDALITKAVSQPMAQGRENQEQEALIVPNPLLVSRMVGEQALLLDPEEDEIQLLNDVGSLIWRCILNKSYTKTQIREELVKCFTVEPAEAEQDLTEFLDLLASKNMIKTLKISTNILVSPLAETGTRKSP
jgi:hypothetical protein